MDVADDILGTIAITLCELLIGISSVLFVFAVNDGWNELHVIHWNFDCRHDLSYEPLNITKKKFKWS